VSGSYALRSDDGAGWRMVSRKLIGGWQTNAIVTLREAFPPTSG
jgi:hypothetical protein